MLQYKQLVTRALLLTVASTIIILALHIRRTFREQICLASPHPITWQLLLFRHLPSRGFSRFMGWLTGIEPPLLLRCVFLPVFVWFFDVKLNEAEEDKIWNYTSLGNLFKRRLKPQCRPINKIHDLVR